MPSNSEPLLKIERLSIGFDMGESTHLAVQRASIGIHRGEVAALVGESGSGKTLLARSIVGLLPRGARVLNGEIFFRAQRVMPERAREASQLRGREVTFVFQEPLSALNPSLRIGTQLTEGLRFHERCSAAKARDRALGLLERVHIRAPETVMRQYPHQLSGGMRQRTMIAASLMSRPSLLVADEPTTALDMIVQQEVLTMLREVARESGTAVLLISHDLSAVAEVADTVAVMKQGRVVEHGAVSAVLRSPRDAYTRTLLTAAPRPVEHDAVPQARQNVARTPVLDIRGLSVEFRNRVPHGRAAKVRVLHGIDLSVSTGETLAIIGESGSGKTTLSRVAAGLQSPTAGIVRLNGHPVDHGKHRAGAVQFVFQDPQDSLDPRMRVAAIVAEGLRFIPGEARSERWRSATAALLSVGLDETFLGRFPHQLSGGQRQRVSIARAIITRPELIVADEPVSALDLTVQKQVLELFASLQRELGFACLFVSHDLGVVERLAHRVGVLKQGRLVEIGTRDQVFNAPGHAYTRQLIDATRFMINDEQEGFQVCRRQFSTNRHDQGMVSHEPSTSDTEIHYRDLGGGHLVALMPSTIPARENGPA